MESTVCDIPRFGSSSARQAFLVPGGDINDAIQAVSLDCDEKNWMEVRDTPISNVQKVKHPCTGLGKP